MRMRLRFVMGLSMSLALSLTAGCQVPTSAASRTTPKDKPGAEAGATTGAHPIPLESAQRLVELAGQPVELIGKVKLLSDKGMGIISNNSGALISNNGGGLISDKGMGLISDKGLGLVSNNSGGPRSYGVLQAEQEENLLADAAVEVLDAAGQVLVGPDKKPITAVTDKAGHYAFKSPLPAENLVLRIRLYNGGQLFAFVTAEKSATKRTVDIDTASSLGASFVLARYVKKQQNVLNRLPESEAQALQQALEAARGLLKTQAPSYKPDDMVAQAERLQGQSAEVKTTFARIEALLLAGQKDLGNGLPATQVALATPTEALYDPRGEVLIAEMTGGRLRRVDAQGLVRMVAGSGASLQTAEGQEAFSANIGGPASMLYAPDGTLYVSDAATSRIRKITPDGKLYTVAGDGQRKRGALDVPATRGSFFTPTQLARASDGTLYFGEGRMERRDGQARLLSVTPQGLLKQVPWDAPDFSGHEPTGVAVAADGTLWVLSVDNGKTGVLACKKPGAAWEVRLRDLETNFHARLALAPDGGVLFSESRVHRVWRFDPATNAKQLVAGTGQAGTDGAGGPAAMAQLNTPGGLYLKADGTLLITDAGNGLVRRLEKDGRLVTIAGTTGLSQIGSATSVAINQPGGLAVDGQGRLVIAEISSSTIKRLEGQNLSVIAGSTRGFAGDGGPATRAQFSNPSGVAYAGETCYVLDAANLRLRKIAPDGTVSTLAGRERGVARQRRNEPDQNLMGSPTWLAISPDGLPCWTDSLNNQVLRLAKDGLVEVVAGSLEAKAGDAGDGGPATEALLAAPVGLAFDAAGNMYVADTGNLRIRKIDLQGRISTYAGVPAAQVMAKMLTGGLEAPDTVAAEAVLIGPGGLAIDAAGNLYIGEVGTANAASLPLNSLKDLPLALLPKIHARIRKVTPDGKIQTIAGPGTSLLNDPASENTLRLPLGLLIDREGRLIVADGGTNQVKLLPKGSF